MTAGSSLLKNFSWPLKPKKRERSGSGGSWDLGQTKRNRKKSQLGRKSSDVEGGLESSLEIVAPATSDVEFKYTWPIDSFLHQVKSCKGEGLDSRPFEVNVNGVLTTWNLSVRFWVGENGERLSNPFVLCLNLVNCKDDGKQVWVKYRFGIFNRTTEEAEMGPPERVSLKEKSGGEKLHSVGYKNIAISDKHVNQAGDVLLFVRLSIIREEEAVHSLSSDLGSLINDEKSSDLILQAGERKFMVHRNILAARSPVFADLLARMEADKNEPEKQDDPTPSTPPTQQLQPIRNDDGRHSNNSYAHEDIAVASGITRLSNIIEDVNVEEDQKKDEALEAEKCDSAKNTFEDENVETYTTEENSKEENEVEEHDSIHSEGARSRKQACSTNKISSQTKDEDESGQDTLTGPESAAAGQQDSHRSPALLKRCGEKENIFVDLDHSDLSEGGKQIAETTAAAAADSCRAAALDINETSRKGAAVISTSSNSCREVTAAPRKCIKGSSPETMKRLVIDDLPGDTVEQLLKYIYTDNSHNVESFSQTLLAASERYKLPGLKQHCEKHLGEIMSPLNVSDILLLSENYSCAQLKKAALMYCGENHSYIMKDSKWKLIEEENPVLFEEAIALVAPDTCNRHAECLKKGGNRYDAEKSKLGLGSGRKKSYGRKI